MPPIELRKTRTAKSTYDKARAVAELRRKRRRVPVVGGVDGMPDPGPLRELLPHYFPEVFVWEFSQDHLKLIRDLEDFLRGNGGTKAVTMPRGSGKTAVGKATMLLALLYGWRKLCVGISASADKAVNEIMAFVKTELRYNERIRADFRQLIAYVDAAEGKAAKAKTLLTHDDHDAGFSWGMDKLKLPYHPGQPWSEAMLYTTGLLGALRGTNFPLRGGGIQRPDFAFLDDPQTEESAASAGQTTKRERTIMGAVLGMADSDTRMSAYAAMTIIAPDDLADRLTDPERHPEWRGQRMRMVEKWPDAQDTLWQEYRELAEQAMRDGRGMDEATAFYREHRDAMDAGAVLSWPQRIRKGEDSALQTAENLLIELKGEGFAAEYQNAPMAANTSVYEITPEIVLSKLNHLPRRYAPPETAVITAGIDINLDGCRWAVLAVAGDATAWVIDHGQTAAFANGKMSETQVATATNATLSQLVGALRNARYDRNGTPSGLDLIVIDRGFQAQVVQRFVRSLLPGVEVLPAWGAATHKYSANPKRLIGRPGDHCHLHYTEMGRFLLFAADTFRERLQRGLLADLGAPGSISLYGADPVPHTQYAAEICAEQLADKGIGENGSVFYKWTQTVGVSHDYSDATYLALMAAAWRGAIPGDGAKRAEPKPRKTLAELQAEADARRAAAARK